MPCEDLKGKPVSFFSYKSEGLGAAAEGGQSGVVKAGDGRESPPSSPRLRQSTFGATLDFIEALCDASSRLTSFPPVRVHPGPALAANFA